jgi:ABC-type transport system substrate-binding protein
MTDRFDVEETSRPFAMSRRAFLAASGAGSAAVLLGRSASSRFTAQPSRREIARARTESVRRALGVAPAADQFLVTYNDSVGSTYKALDFYETVYSPAPLANNFDMTLVRINKDYQLVPGAATHWAQTSPTTWEFYLRPGIMWSDGKELTASDFVETFRYSADPKHGWDFTWYWSGVIKNYTDAVAGKAPLDSIGVGQKGKYTFVVTTEGPVAFIPAAMLYSMSLSAAGLAKYGNALYNINPATCITCGPYTLKTFDPTAEVVLEPNLKYTGPFKPTVEYQIGKIYAGTAQMPLFETGEIDYTSAGVAKTDVEVAKKTPALSKLHLYVNPQDFEIWYAFFKTKAAPFDNPKVRQAFAHSCNRDAIIDAILAPLAIPAYGYLMPGYPFAVTTPLEKYQNYDPALAQKLLVEAGYPNGKGFPTVTFTWTANGALASSSIESVVQAMAANWNEVLFGGRSVLQIAELDKTTFYSKMEHLPTEIDMGFISYGMDYFDASNMLSVYKGGGRHDWDNAEYDDLLAEGAAAFNTAKRQAIYAAAQELLSDQAPGVFVFHALHGYYFWPYVQGSALTPNHLGYDGLQWPGFVTFSTSQESLWIGPNAGKWPRAGESGLT